MTKKTKTKCEKVWIGKYQVEAKLLYEYLESVKKIVNVKSADSWVLIDALNKIRSDRHFEIMETLKPQLKKGAGNAYGIESARFKRKLADWLAKELDHEEQVIGQDDGYSLSGY